MHHLFSAASVQYIFITSTFSHPLHSLKIFSFPLSPLSTFITHMHTHAHIHTSMHTYMHTHAHWKTDRHIFIKFGFQVWEKICKYLFLWIWPMSFNIIFLKMFWFYFCVYSQIGFHCASIPHFFQFICWYTLRLAPSPRSCERGQQEAWICKFLCSWLRHLVYTEELPFPRYSSGWSIGYRRII